ncbi:hypothetical protein MTO96_000357 [Rhipicephalus appendiculatus]
MLTAVALCLLAVAGACSADGSVGKPNAAPCWRKHGQRRDACARACERFRGFLLPPSSRFGTPLTYREGLVDWGRVSERVAAWAARDVDPKQSVKLGARGSTSGRAPLWRWDGNDQHVKRRPGTPRVIWDARCIGKRLCSSPLRGLNSRMCAVHLCILV